MHSIPKYGSSTVSMSFISGPYTNTLFVISKFSHLLTNILVAVKSIILTNIFPILSTIISNFLLIINTVSLIGTVNKILSPINSIFVANLYIDGIIPDVVVVAEGTTFITFCAIIPITVSPPFSLLSI